MIEEIKKIVIKDIEEKGKSEGKDEWQIDDEIKEVEKAKRLSSLGFNLVEAIQLLQDNNIPVVLTEEDKNKIETQEKILKEKSDFVCVHKTKITKQALNKEKMSMNINKESLTRNNDEMEREK